MTKASRSGPRKAKSLAGVGGTSTAASDWRKFKEKVISAVNEAKQKDVKAGDASGSSDGVETVKKPPNLPPYEKPKSVLKRMVYEFVLSYDNINEWMKVHYVINKDSKREKDLYPRKDGNRFHGVFSRLRFYILDLKKEEVSRFSQQLDYASRHKVPPGLLIGFIYQSGGEALISKRIANKEMEAWYNYKRLREYQVVDE